MIYSTYLWWFGRWFIIALPTLVPSGNLTVCYWKLHIEIVDLPTKDDDFPFSYVSLSEGMKKITMADLSWRSMGSLII